MPDMILSSKNCQFVFYFPPDFWSDKIKKQYASFYTSLMLPYDSIDDYVLSTLQSISLQGWQINGSDQVRYRGAEQRYKGSAPVKDTIEKKMTLTFKMSEGFSNYMLFRDNAIEYLDHENKAQYYSPFYLGLLNNEGYLMTTVSFKKVVMSGQGDVSLDYSSVDSQFNKFTVSFFYNDWDMENVFDKMINLYETV